MRRAGIVVITLIIASGAAHAQGGVDDSGERRFIVGAGGAVEGDFTERSTNGGASMFVEWEAIDEWLEMELGVSVLAAEGGAEIPIDLLFKKPFRFSERLEIMVGLGPEWVVYRGTRDDGGFFAVEIAVDVMFWLSHRLGLWAEPSYEMTFRSGTEHSLASTGGVMIGW